MKKKLLAICLVTIIAVVAITGASLAYLTDNHTQVNTFTSGNVKITLDESVVKLDQDGYIYEVSDERTDAPTQNYGKMYPGQIIKKDPTITNVGSEKAYIAAKITVTAPNLEALIGTNYEGLVGIQTMVQGGLLNTPGTVKPEHPLYGILPVYGDENYSVYQVKEAVNTHVFYIFIEKPLAPEQSVMLFEELVINPEWNNDQMANISNMSITVDAYAVQVQTFDTCLKAMTTAFGNAFDFN